MLPAAAPGRSRPWRRGLLLGAALLIAAMAGAAQALPAPAATGAQASLEPRVEPARRGPCIADPATMRRSHMEMLKHQRNDTVHLGARDGPTSLKACVACHAGRVSDSVAAAPGDFCVACHSYAAVQIDCFECHANRPASSVAAVQR